MPNSPHNPPTSATALRTYLEGVLPGATLTDAPVDSAYQPLLLMLSKHILAAFAFSNGDMRKSYEALYASFKTYYASQRGKWDALDLAFVFCVEPGDQNLDFFCSNVETDVYFCRKFVVLLAQPLSVSLARLPFLPLTPVHGPSLRPASAQTFLQQCRVPAVLARYLVVQHERGPERIVEDCLSGEFGEPKELQPAANEKVAQSDRATEPVMLESVSIQHFRAYRRSQAFSIGAEVTVLYGPNGFGKTSFFDAIDFAITGGIGRLEPSSEAHFKNTAQHLDSKSEGGVVSLSFQCNGVVRTLTRKVADRKHGSLDGSTTDRKAILAELTRGSIPATDRVENLVSLFRATHLFSQEHQELTKDFREDCQLSAQIVSRMLAFEDYANAVSKAGKVRNVLETAIESASAEIRELSGQITEDKKELDRLRQIAQPNAKIEALDPEIEALRKKLIAVGISASDQKPDTAVVRGWRASLEARQGESQSRSARLASLTREAAGLPRVRAELASLQSQLAEKEKAFAAAEEKRIAAELALQRAEQSLAQIKAKSAEAQSHASLFEWIRATRPAYVQLREKQRSIDQEVNRAAEALALLRTAEEQAANGLRSQETRVADAAGTLKVKCAGLAAIQSLSEAAKVWEANRARIVLLVESDQAETRSLELLRAEERELLPQANQLAAEEARISRLIAEADRGQSELKTLVLQLLGHVQSGTCPLCGEDHGSKEELMRRIQGHVAADAISGARADLANARDRARQLAERIAGIKQKQQTAEAQIVTLKKERARLDAEIGQFANAAAQLGIGIEASGPLLTGQLRVRYEQLQNEIGDLNRLIRESGVAVDAARASHANAKTLVASKAVELADRQAALGRVREDADRLRNDPRLTRVSIDISDEQLADIERLNLEQLAKYKAEAGKAEAESAHKTPEVGGLRQELASLKNQIAASRTQITNLQKNLTQVSARLEESRLPPDTSEELLLKLVAEESRQHAQLVALRDSVSNLELAIDAATTAAALTQMLHNVRNKEKAVAHAAKKRERHQPWLAYFDEVARLVESQQNAAIANFTREYGPRTSIIQRRLRSVYGFDDIEIQSRESAISVRVKRQGVDLRPTDYFSQSQQQTLLLGLFLTACSSQTWSAFSPVFLDDPVTHFDDLNTYAFLDLIVGLLESDFGKRQFIISTCDEKLLQLARQKFRHLGERAKFYRFGAIGREGPTVEESF